jgi:hypothetical protein
MTDPTFLKPGPGRRLLLAVREFIDREWPYWQSGGVLPEGLRLEMHPAAYHLLLRDPSLYPGWMSDPQEEARKLVPVPLKVTADLEPGHWRLVVVTEDVRLGGVLNGGS